MSCLKENQHDNRPLGYGLLPRTLAQIHMGQKIEGDSQPEEITRWPNNSQMKNPLITLPQTNSQKLPQLDSDGTKSSKRGSFPGIAWGRVLAKERHIRAANVGNSMRDP